MHRVKLHMKKAFIFLRFITERHRILTALSRGLSLYRRCFCSGLRLCAFVSARCQVEEWSTEMKNNNAPPMKRKSFDPLLCARVQNTEKRIPKASELTQAEAFACPPPEEVSRKLGNASMAMGFDIETHDLVERGGEGVGRFGHPWRSKPSIFQLHVVQIGWAIGGCAQQDPINERGERLIKPENFEISKHASEKHGISNEQAKELGAPLSEVLEEFMRTALRVHESGGIVVSHHIEFDAGVIDEELGRCGMGHWRPQWSVIAAKGVCTMDPSIQAWLQFACGNEKGPGVKSLVMKLTSSLMLFYQSSARVRDLVKNAHQAGADSEMHLLLYRALRDLAVRGNVHAT